MPEINYEILKPGHKIVLQSLEAANQAFERVVTAREVVEALTEPEKRQLQKNYAKPLHQVVSVILELLDARKLVFIKKGRVKRYYGALSLLDPAKSELPGEPVSRRRLVLQAVREAVELNRRAVYPDEVYTHAKGELATRHLTRQLVVRDMNNLAATGELKTIDTIYGEGAGRNLYMPAELNADNYLPQKPLTWLELVAEAFAQIWREKVEQAILEKVSPFPITTAELRARLESAPQPHERLSEPRAVTNALKYLAEAKRPSVRRITTGTTNVFWCPIDIPDIEVDVENVHAADSHKIAVALKRAFERLSRPVTAAEVEVEIKRDVFLKLAAKNSVARALTDASKNRIGGVNGESFDRVNLLALRAGLADGSSYYCPPNANLEEARCWVDLVNLTNEWQILSNAENIELFEACKLPGVAFGRARLFLESAAGINSKIAALISNREISATLQIRAANMKTEINAKSEQVENWLGSSLVGELPERVMSEIELWTAEELLRAYAPLYPAAAAIKDSNKIIVLLAKQVRRVHNQKFVSQFSSNSSKAARYLFDRADALIYAALRWGGPECRFQALTARHELGTLRDYRFVLPALKSSSYEERLTAISCLAFLRSTDTHKHLRRVCLEDENANVRQSALWAYSFCDGQAWKKLAEVRKWKDINVEVQKFAETVNSTTSDGLWFL